MSGKVLEARAVIYGDDRTKAMFASIMRNVDVLMAKMESIGKLTSKTQSAIGGADAAIGRMDRSFASAAGRMERAAGAMERAAAAVGRVSRGGSTLGIGGRGHGGHRGPHAAANFLTPHGARYAVASGGYGVGGFAGAVGAVVVGEGALHAFEKGAERQHERVRMDISGMSPAEREEAERRAAVLAAKYASISQTDIMHTLRNARSITGSYGEASEIADELLRTRLVAQAARPGQDVEGDFDRLLKGMEQFGVTQNPAAFREAMQRVQKVLAVEGDTLTADGIYQSFKYSRQALPGASQRFMLGTAPALAQEMGGSSFGNALSSFNQAIVQGRLSGRSLKLAMDLGLIDKEDINFDKDGTAKSVKTALEGGHGFKDWQAAKSDPDLWIWNRLTKALDEHKITDPNVISQIASTLFGNRMAADFVGKIITQRARIEKNQANLAAAPADPAARIMAGDPITAWEGVKAAFDNLGATITSSGSAVPKALNAISSQMNEAAARLQGATTDKARIAENQQKYGITSDRDFSKAPVDDLVEAKRKALEADAAKIAAKRLELKGLLGEIAKRNAEREGSGVWGRLGFGGKETGTLVARSQALRAELADIETATSRLKSLGDAYEQYKRAVADNPAAHLINQRGGAAVPNFRHASFPLGSTYGHVDPATGRNFGVAAPPDVLPTPGAGAEAQDRITRALSGNPFGSLSGPGGGSIKAELEGAVTISSSFEVRPSSELIEIVNKAQKLTSNSPLVKAGAPQMNVGTGAPGTGPAGRTPTGR